MAWPKKGTRKIVVDNEAFLWHYDAHCPWCSDDVFTAGKAGKPFVLFIDPFPWVAEMGPKYVAKAIRWARANGWSSSGGPTRALSINSADEQFFWLEDGERHAKCIGPAPENV
ncbi:hypothetical protein [Marinicella meishanensis]|uniref:hypothetical protein n=1 Tax=Marinicella meishanensis TaxID=2873263 RepID=UPI001CBE2824|nr:hypothetical protein [Marinicella sp. NBU2979]